MLVFVVDRSDVPVDALERAFPVLVPALTGIEISGQEIVPGHHDPVVDRLGMKGHRKRGEQDERVEHTRDTRTHEHRDTKSTVNNCEPQ